MRRFKFRKSVPPSPCKAMAGQVKWSHKVKDHMVLARDSQHESAHYRADNIRLTKMQIYKNFYSDDDLNKIIEFVKVNGLKKIFITGPMQSGKSKFCKYFTNYCRNYKFIELDKERDHDTTKSRSEVLHKCINENKNTPFILEHYDLLNENYFIDSIHPNTLDVWKKDADCLILLNPLNKVNQTTSFSSLVGEILYENSNTGTYFKFMRCE